MQKSKMIDRSEKTCIHRNLKNKYRCKSAMKVLKLTLKPTTAPIKFE